MQQMNTPKLLLYFLLLLLFTHTTLVSCAKDEAFIDLVGLDEDKDGTDPDGNGSEDPDKGGEDPDPGNGDDGSQDGDSGPDFDSSEGLKISTTPCDFTLSGIESNATVEIDCRMDLGGQTITLPTGVALTFKGGEIINGTLNFSGQGVIDGNLLNKDLTIEGDVRLSDPVFQFYPERWDIVQGNVDMQRAKDNSLGIQEAVDLVHTLSGSTFEIDVLDAFFYGKDVYNYNIVMPSNFHLKMTDNTHLRTFPSVDEYSTFLIIIQGVENVRVTGGHLHGDRDLYNTMDNLPRSHTMKIKTGVNVVIENVHMSNATQDGLAIESIRFAYDSNYVGSNNVLIKNCVFDSNRRINLTITDGHNITVEGCTFIDGGINTSKSNASAPSCNLNIEPLRGRDGAGNLIEYQRVENVTIRNNKQYVRNISEQPNAGDFLVSHGFGPIIVENNEMIDTGVSFHTVNGVIIRNNTITGGGINAGSAETFDREDFVYGNEVTGNNVTSNGTALNISGNGVVARNNHLEGVVGISLGAGSTDRSRGTSNVEVTENYIQASSRGIISHNTMHNVLVDNNEIVMMTGANFAFALNNEWSNASSSANFVISNNSVSGNKSNSTTGAPPSLLGANSIDFINNNSGDIQINGGSRMKITGNNIDANIGEDGIYFGADAPNSTVADNSITIYPSRTPLNVQCITQANGVSLSSSVNISSNNTCTEQ